MGTDAQTMNIQASIDPRPFAVKLTARNNAGTIIGWAYLYIIFQDRHAEPYGYAENVYIVPEERGKGIGTDLIRAVVAEARRQGCYKVIGTSKTSNERAHIFYERLGFRNVGVEFRIDLKESAPLQHA